MDNVNMADIINTVGLSLDIAGALILFKFGLPSTYDTGGTMLLEESDEEEQQRKKKNRLISLWAHAGLVLLITGFALQLVATWL